MNLGERLRRGIGELREAVYEKEKILIVRRKQLCCLISDRGHFREITFGLQKLPGQLEIDDLWSRLHDLIKIPGITDGFPKNQSHGRDVFGIG